MKKDLETKADEIDYSGSYLVLGKRRPKLGVPEEDKMKYLTAQERNAAIVTVLNADTRKRMDHVIIGECYGLRQRADGTAERIRVVELMHNAEENGFYAVGKGRLEGIITLEKICVKKADE